MGNVAKACLFQLTKISDAIGPSGPLDQLLNKPCSVLARILQGWLDHIRVLGYFVKIFITKNELRAHHFIESAG